MLVILMRLSCAFFLGGLLGIGIMLWLGQSQPEPQYADLVNYGITACDLPCTMGILPGRTPPEAVQTRLLAHIPALEGIQIYSPGNINFSAMTRGRTITGTVRHGGDSVTVVNLATISLPLAYLLAQLGEPHCIEYIPATTNRAGLILHWQGQQVAATTILMQAPAAALHHNGSTQDWRVTLEKRICQGKIAWRGFLPLWKYALLSQIW